MTEETPLALNPKETGVVFIEFQNEFTTEGGALHDAVKGENTECLILVYWFLSLFVACRLKIYLLLVLFIKHM